MSGNANFSFSLQRSSVWWPAPKLLLSLGVILLCAVGFIAASSIREEQRRMLFEMKSRADVLIWALEGAARSLVMPHERTSLSVQPFLEEVAKQPYIAYLALTDSQGLIVAHSDPGKIGMMLHDAGSLVSMSGMSESRGALLSAPDREVYEVAKLFTPVFAHGRHMGHGMGRGRQRGLGGMPMDREGAGYFIFAGVDAEPFASAFRKNVLYTAGLSFFICLAGMTGLVLLFYLQNYRASRKQLMDARSLTLQVFENLPIGVFTTDERGRITLRNKQINELFRISRKAKEPAAIQEYPYWDWHGLMTEVAGKGSVLEREGTMHLPEGRELPVSLSCARIINSEGVPAGYLFILRDLGEVKKLQEQVRLNERLSALGNLAAGVAHEVRNPLSTIKGYAVHLAGKFAPQDPAHETGKMMIHEVERLNKVVSDLLSVAKIGELERKPMSLLPVAEHAARLAGPEASEKGVSLEVLHAGLEERELMADIDGDRLIQAFLNLLINAVQATETGGEIRVSLHKQQEPSGVWTARISFSDNGCGMSYETRRSLFSPYFTTKPSGTGLGLTITHQIIEQHGGEIAVQSLPGKGATFTVTLPLSA